MQIAPSKLRKHPFLPATDYIHSWRLWFRIAGEQYCTVKASNFGPHVKVEFFSEDYHRNASNKKKMKQKICRRILDFQTRFCLFLHIINSPKDNIGKRRSNVSLRSKVRDFYRSPLNSHHWRIYSTTGSGTGEKEKKNWCVPWRTQRESCPKVI
jgi:hypothetical protein